MPLSKDSEALASYIHSVGGHLSSSLDFLSPAGAGGRGVVAVAPVRKGSNLAAVPVRSCLFVPKQGEHASTPAAAFLRDYISKSEEEKKHREGGGGGGGGAGGEEKEEEEKDEQPLLSPFAATVALLLAEAAAGKLSPHSQFLASLPFGGALVDENDDEDDLENENGSTVKCLDCVRAWRSKERRLLASTSAHDDGGGARKVFDTSMKPLYASNPQLWPRPFDSFAAFVRAACLVQSRAFHLRATNFATGATSDGADGGTLYLIPGIDQVNHSGVAARRSTALERVSASSAASARGAVEVEGGGFEGGGGDDEEKKGKGGKKAAKEEKEEEEEKEKVDFFCMKAERDVAAGEEVFHGYGDHLSDSDLLTTYGFVPQEGREGEGEGDGEEEGDGTGGTNPNNVVLLPSDYLVEAARAVTGGDGGVSERAAALREAGALPPLAFSITRGDPPIPDALFGAASLLCLGKVAAVGAAGASGGGGESSSSIEEEEEEQEKSAAAEALWLEAKGDLRSVAERLGAEEALEGGAPEVAYAAGLAIREAAAEALELLNRAAAAAAAAAEAEEEARKKGGGDAVFSRRAELARAVRQWEIDTLKMLRLSAMQVAAAALEALAEEEEDEEESEEDDEDDGDDGGEEEATAAAAAPSSSKDKKRAAASKAAAPSSEKNKRKKRGD